MLQQQRHPELGVDGCKPRPAITASELARTLGHLCSVPTNEWTIDQLDLVVKTMSGRGGVMFRGEQDAGLVNIAHEFLEERLYPLEEADKAFRDRLDPWFVTFNFTPYNGQPPGID